MKQTEHLRLGKYTSFQLGGPCRALIHCNKPEDLVLAVTQLRNDRRPCRVMGGGSNILISDQGLDEVVVRYASEEMDWVHEGDWIRVAGCAPLDALAELAARKGWKNLVFASGIPGTVAGAVMGNAGAFGRSISDAVRSVRILDCTGAVMHVPVDEVGFHYRASRFQVSGETVLDVLLQPVGSSDAGACIEEREQILALRREKHPDWRDTPCAGSVFKNIEIDGSDARREAAGVYLDKVGARKMKLGGATVYHKHANIIIKASSDCTAQDVMDLARRMKDAVAREFGVTLVPELNFWGKFDPAFDGKY